MSSPVPRGGGLAPREDCPSPRGAAKLPEAEYPGGNSKPVRSSGTGVLCCLLKIGQLARKAFRETFRSC